MRHPRLTMFAVALALGNGTQMAQGDPLGTAFMYQGRLQQGGTPVTGTVQMVFDLHDDPASGDPLGSSGPLSVQVTDGLFTVPLDFGSDVFVGEARWLEVTVEGTPLSPRQELTPAPYALTASQTVGVDGHSLDAVDGSPTDAVLVDSTGRVRMEQGGLAVFDAVGQGIALTSDYIQFAEAATEDSVYTYLGTTGAHQFWTNGARRMAITADGDVGIGTQYPGSRLHVKTTAGGYAIQAESHGAGYNCAVDAFVESPEGNAIYAFNEGGTGNAHAILGETASETGTAIYGWASNADLWDSSNIGVHGRADGDNNSVGVYGEANNPNPDGTTYGVRGVSVEGTGVHGENQYTGNYGALGSLTYGVRGVSYGGGAAVVGVAGGWGSAGSFVVSDDTNSQPAVKGNTYNPDGYAGYFTGGRNYFEGAVGIGTANPQAKLHVNGTTRVNVLEIVGADVAEKFPVSEEVEPGLVVAIDPEHPGRLCLARGAYNRCVAGVVSGANNLPTGAVLGHLPGHDGAPPIALSGRVWVRCDATEQPIEPGDLLTTSSSPGHAMKVTDYGKAQGAVIGKAMSELREGRGLVLVLVSLQ